jgi:hypothetical protein
MRRHIALPSATLTTGFSYYAATGLIYQITDPFGSTLCSASTYLDSLGPQ